jgi:hypothetical protein
MDKKFAFLSKTRRVGGQGEEGYSLRYSLKKYGFRCFWKIGRDSAVLA